VKVSAQPSVQVFEQEEFHVLFDAPDWGLIDPGYGPDYVVRVEKRVFDQPAKFEGNYIDTFSSGRDQWEASSPAASYEDMWGQAWAYAKLRARARMPTSETNIEGELDDGDPNHTRRASVAVKVTGRGLVSFTVGAWSNGKLPISYTIGTAGVVTLTVLYPSGQLARTLQSGVSAPIGTQTVFWDGKNNAGQAVPNGTYLCRFAATLGGVQVQATKSFMLLR